MREQKEIKRTGGHRRDVGGMGEDGRGVDGTIRWAIRGGGLFGPVTLHHVVYLLSKQLTPIGQNSLPCLP